VPIRPIALILAAFLAAIRPLAAAPITPEQQDRDTAGASDAASLDSSPTEGPQAIAITGLRLGMTREEVVAVLKRHTPELVLDWHDLSLGYFQFAQAFLAAETPRWAGARASGGALVDARSDPTQTADAEQDGYLVAFSAATGRTVAIFRQYTPPPGRPLVLATTEASVKQHYPFLVANGVEGTGAGPSVIILGGPKPQMDRCSNQRQYMVAAENFQESRNYTIAGFDPQAVRDPAAFDDARSALLASRFNSTAPPAPPPEEPNWAGRNCGPVLAVSLLPRGDDPSLVQLLTLHLYDIRTISTNLSDLAERMRQAEAVFLNANAANRPPL
jgi:hypothetical protein